MAKHQLQPAFRVTPVRLPRRRRKWVAGGAIILLLNIVFFDYVLAVFWPEPFILDFFRR